jgi:FeS assembly SUF system protein
MGLFSFFSGKGGGAGTADDQPQATDQAATPATADPTPTSSTGDAAVPAGATPAAGETPFVPPDAWDVNALTAPPPPSATTAQPQVGPPDPALTADLQGPIIEVIKTVYDPEIPVDIYELGLIYDIIVDADRRALVRMTLTSPACPSAQQLPSEVRYKVKAVEGISDAAVDVVWDPPWDKDRMSEAARLQLGFF